MTDKGGHSIKKRKNIYTKEQRTKSGDNLVIL